MTTTELKNLIKTKLEGQGNQIDIGNALADILNELVEPTPLKIEIDSSQMGLNLEEMAAHLHITKKETEALFNGEYRTININNNVLLFLCEKTMDSIYKFVSYQNLNANESQTVVSFSWEGEGNNYDCLIYEN